MDIDVFNGDADGICALLQLRLDKPVASKLVTGVKRDIELLKRVEAGAGDRVTVLDISMAKNRRDLDRVLECGATVLYVDHHQPGDIPEHPGLQAIIDTDASTCTSLLVDDYLNGKYRAWAVVAAFGDNLNDSALKAAKPLDLSAEQLDRLQQLGICINYNGYGGGIEDLHIAPDRLFLELSQYASPFEFMSGNQTLHRTLLDGYAEDMDNAKNISAEFENGKIAVYILPKAVWSRRVSGVFGNYLANQNPDCAYAVLSHNSQGGFLISVRAPLNNKTGADELCSSFATGGGRKAAAGINHLSQAELQTFIDAFADQYKG